MISALFCLSAASLVFEITLSRLFSVAQFYHFAFLIVSLALLGSGASGTALAIFPRLGSQKPVAAFRWLALACAASILGGYLVINSLPFDSFSLVWDRRQLVILVVHYLLLAAPFFFSGMGVGLLLSLYPQAAGGTYAANLLGSAVGCAIALLAPLWLGGEGAVVLGCGLAALAVTLTARPGGSRWEVGLLRSLCHRARAPSALPLGLAYALLLFAALDFAARLARQPTFSFLALRISPYKSLSYALQYPEAQLIFQRWNSFSRVDVVRSAGIRSLPGLSFRYLQPLPGEQGLFIDGDDLSPVILPGQDLAFSAYMPAAVAFELRPQAETLVLEPRGGLDLWVALAQGASRVTAVEVNPLIVQAANPVYRQSRVRVVVESERSFLRRTRERYEVIVLSLANSYHPVRSGAYSLAEEYRYTQEAFMDALNCLESGGFLVVTRWLQSPPSESLRLFALAVSAVEQSGGEPRQQIVVFRGYSTATLLVKKGALSAGELDVIRRFSESRAYDLVFAPDLLPEETNRYNVLPEAVYSQAFAELLEAQPREAFYRAYPFDVRPPSDDRPFFGHYFKWSQARQVWAELGTTWEPFGGAGYFVVLALLVLAILFSSALVLLPALLAAWRGAGQAKQAPPGAARTALPDLLYFAWIGFAYLLVEIPLIQRFILFLGHPAYAMSAVLFTLLLFSGIGSRLEQRFSHCLALGLLVGTLLLTPVLLPRLFEAALPLPFGWRLGISVAILAPVGLLMGIPFPAGIRWLLRRGNRAPLVAWVWGVNGSASVISAVLAALLALSFGFSWVLRAGALCYALAWLTVWAGERVAPHARPAR
ncbi:MAG: hypothetical protein PHS96_12475 [Anaerolineales bacterium]|nr:hypothetical protein [Anaerolineales bacterium]